MWIGIIIFACLCELVGVWFVHDKAHYTIGLLLGALLSCASVYHMWYVLDRSLGTDEKKAARLVGSGYIIRYCVLIILIVVLYFTDFASPFAAFLGYMGMKPAAYIQPYTHKVTDRIIKRR